jgi:hypothetical protein
MCYVTIYCDPQDGSAQRIYVRNYQTDQVPGAALEEVIEEARRLYQADGCKVDVHLHRADRRSSP